MEDVSLALRIDTWTREALATCGCDWSRITEHIERRLAALAPTEKRAVAAETALTLLQAHEAVKN
jgi:hypothetical protein